MNATDDILIEIAQVIRRKRNAYMPSPSTPLSAESLRILETSVFVLDDLARELAMLASERPDVDPKLFLNIANVTPSRSNIEHIMQQPNGMRRFAATFYRGVLGELEDQERAERSDD